MYAEIFHIIHKAIWAINEGRPLTDKVCILDREIGGAATLICKEDIPELQKACRQVVGWSNID